MTTDKARAIAHTIYQDSLAYQNLHQRYHFIDQQQAQYDGWAREYVECWVRQYRALDYAKQWRGEG